MDKEVNQKILDYIEKHLHENLEVYQITPKAYKDTNIFTPLLLHSYNNQTNQNTSRYIYKK